MDTSIEGISTLFTADKYMNFEDKIKLKDGLLTPCYSRKQKEWQMRWRKGDAFFKLLLPGSSIMVLTTFERKIRRFAGLTPVARNTLYSIFFVSFQIDYI